MIYKTTPRLEEWLEQAGHPTADSYAIDDAAFESERAALMKVGTHPAIVDDKAVYRCLTKNMAPSWSSPPTPLAMVPMPPPAKPVDLSVIESHLASIVAHLAALSAPPIEKPSSLPIMLQIAQVIALWAILSALLLK